MDTLSSVQAFETIPLQNLGVPTGVDYDPVDGKVYWTDTDTKSISRAFLNGTAQEVVITLSDVSSKNHKDFSKMFDTVIDKTTVVKYLNYQMNETISMAHF